jgi:hypothetical protein
MCLGTGVNDPTPPTSGNRAAITPRPVSGTELVSDDFQVFHQLFYMTYSKSDFAIGGYCPRLAGATRQLG